MTKTTSIGHMESKSSKVTTKVAACLVIVAASSSIPFCSSFSNNEFNIGSSIAPLRISQAQVSRIRPRTSRPSNTGNQSRKRANRQACSMRSLRVQDQVLTPSTTSKQILNINVYNNKSNIFSSPSLHPNLDQRLRRSRRWFLEDERKLCSVAKSTTKDFFIRTPSSHELLQDFLYDSPLHPLEEPKSEYNLFNDDSNILNLPPWLQQYDIGKEPYDEVTPFLLEEKRRELCSKMAAKSYLSEEEIDRVILGIQLAVDSSSSTQYFSRSGDSAVRLNGVMDFLLILVEYMEMGSSALIAAAFHYCSCVTARQKGDKSEMEKSLSRNSIEKDDIYHQSFMHQSSVPDIDSAYLLPLAGSGIEQFDEQTVRIALDAARLKGTESIAAAVFGINAPILNNNSHQGTFFQPALRKGDAKNLRSLLLTANAGGDWRALAIRCAACLYRLQGLESFRQLNLRPSDPATPSEIAVAREALYIFAPLAHRLGMHILKSKLEGVAFRILYRRQYDAVNSLLSDNANLVKRRTNSRGIPLSSLQSPLYFAKFATCVALENEQDEDVETIGEGLKSVLQEIKHLVKRILQEDETLMEHVSSIEVSARVKEPYSLWKKMLKLYRKSVENGEKNPTFSVMHVPDAVALRIIVRARKLSSDEDNEVTKGREKALCYYAQQLCMNNLPSTTFVSDVLKSEELGDGCFANDYRMKDYIESPKTNGYQSLHYSSRMRWHGDDWPFEVQIRSADMHRVAEYGLAAHWDYKESHKNGVALSKKSVSDTYLSTLSRIRDEEVHLQSRDFQSWDSPSSNDLKSRTNASLTYSESIARDHEHKQRADRVRAREERLAPYIDALSNARLDLAREHVFVFFNQPCSDGNVDSLATSLPGSILSLPAGSRVLDALKEKEMKSGMKFCCAQSDVKARSHTKEEFIIFKNGKTTSCTDILKNGDILTYHTHQEKIVNR